MTALELRIGNIVSTPNQPTFRIDLFDYVAKGIGKFGQISDANTHPLTWYLQDLKPIPLTEEWLLKFSFFECSDNGELKGNDRFFINSKLKGSIGLSPKFTYSLTGTRLYYVHQLQNLYYALTGQELTIQ